MYIICWKVHVDVNHGLKRSAEGHNFENLHQVYSKWAGSSTGCRSIVAAYTTAGPQRFLQDHISAKQWLKWACNNAHADQSLLCVISQTSKLSLGERWAHMQSYRKCCATAEISEILLAGFVLIKFLATSLQSVNQSTFYPLFCLFTWQYEVQKRYRSIGAKM